MYAILKIKKLRYLQNHLANFDKILHVGAYIYPDLNSSSKIQISKNPRWQIATILKNVKHDILATIWQSLVKLVMYIGLSNRSGC